MSQQKRKTRNIDTKNLPQNPRPCMIVPDPDDVWEEEGYVSSTGMS